NYNGQNETITIKQLLAQTSGIPSDITSEDSVTSKNNRLNDVTHAIYVVISANLISIGSQVSTKDQLLLPRMRYGNAYNMSAKAIHIH
ncbi:hypothetical protein CEJ90_15300, partial [Staphylococcus aureus]